MSTAENLPKVLSAKLAKARFDMRFRNLTVVHGIEF